jgi:hypothetical protein
MRYFIPLLLAGSVATGLAAQQVTKAPTPTPGAGCAPIGTPQPSRVYTYEHHESTGRTTKNTQQWESVTPTGSKVRTTGPDGVTVQVNTHKFVNNVAMLSLSLKTTANGGLISSTDFSPDMVSDPVVRACPGASWNIAPVTVIFRLASGKGGNSTMTGGSLRIVTVREKITVPAGTFDTVHYVRTLSTSTDEYWKSLDHGVIVKHYGRLAQGAGVVTETLMSIK